MGTISIQNDEAPPNLIIQLTDRAIIDDVIVRDAVVVNESIAGIDPRIHGQIVAERGWIHISRPKVDRKREVRIWTHRKLYD